MGATGYVGAMAATTTKPPTKAKKKPTKRPAPKPVGRPPKCTEAVMARMEHLLSVDGLNRERASRLAGISIGTFYRWMAEADIPGPKTQRYREFRDRVTRAEDQFIARGMAGVAGDAFRQDEEGNYVHELRDRISAFRAVFPARFPAEFATRHDVRTSGPDGGPVQVVAEVAVRPLLTDAQLAELPADKLAAFVAGLVGGGSSTG